MDLLYRGSASRCYATGCVTGQADNPNNLFTGGLIGDVSSATINACYYDIVTTEQNDTGKGEPKSTEVMQSQAMVDLLNNGQEPKPWKILANNYPRLSWENIGFSVNVTNGTATPETAREGQSVTLTADDKPGWAFTQWTGNIELLDADSINKASIKFVMPAQAVSFEATYEKIPYSVTVTNGTANPATAYLDSIVTLIADEKPGWAFTQWTGNIELLDADSINKASIKFVMPAQTVSFEATYEKIPYSVTVTNGTANTATAYLDSIVTLTAEERAEDWRFIGWACDDASLLDADSIMLKSTTFIMPAKSVSFEATYEEILWEHGTGEEATPYEIWTRADLELLATNVNAGTDYAGVYFKLMSNIDLGTIPEGRTDSAWFPIGWFDRDRYVEYHFSGTLDGDSHVISNMYVDTIRYAGLFGRTQNATIINLGVKNVEIYSSYYAGGLIGVSENDDIHNCYATGKGAAAAIINEDRVLVGGLIGSSEGATVTNCYAAMDITATINGSESYAYTGGLIGGNYSDVSNCHALGSGTVMSNGAYSGAYAGGLIAYNYGRIENCYAAVTISAMATGDEAEAYVGGLLEYNDGNVVNCYATGTATVTACYAYTGGLIAYNKDGYVANSYAAWSVSVTPIGDEAESSVGGLIGYNDIGDNVTNSYYDATLNPNHDNDYGTPMATETMKGSQGLVDLLNNQWLNTTWHFAREDYPKLNPNPSERTINLSGEGTQASPYLINNRADLALLAEAVNSGFKTAGLYFELTNHIDLGGAANPWTPIGNAANRFSGTFEGGRHVISNVYVNTTSHAGLFGYTQDAAIVNLGVENVEIYGALEVGGLVGYNNARVENCYATGAVTIRGDGNFSDAYAGGLIGCNDGKINNCYAIVMVMATSRSYTAAGGLIGDNYDNVENCYAMGNVTAITREDEADAGGLIGDNYDDVMNCYATGAVAAFAPYTYTGGLIGYNDDAVSHCYYDRETTGQSDVDNSTPMSTNDMKLPAFVNLLNGNPSSNAWKAFSNNYPQLSWEKDGFSVAVTKGVAMPRSAGEGQTVTLTANVPQSGWAFAGWDGDDIALLEADSKMLESTTFVMPSKNVVFTATYKELFWANGTGEEDAPYEIWNRQDLKLLADKVRTGHNYRDSYFKLMADIDLEGKSKPWTPIGWYNVNDDISYSFSGTFDGDSHVISNIFVDTTRDAGLFGRTQNAAIFNLGVENVEICSFYYAGGLIGHCEDGIITNCYATGTVSAAATGSDDDVHVGGLIGRCNVYSVTNCYAMVTITATVRGAWAYAYSGGLIGGNYSDVSNCYAAGAVTAKSSRTYSGAYAAGLIGYNYGHVESCYAAGAASATTDGESAEVYADGLIECNYGSVANCYATGSVSAAATGSIGYVYAGGLIGSNDGPISYSYAVGKVSAEGVNTYIGGLSGFEENDGDVENCYYDQETTGQSDDVGKGEPLETKYMIVSAFVDTLNGNPSSGAWKRKFQDYPRLYWENIGFSVNVTNGTAAPETAREGQSVTLTADDKPGWTFTGWIGDEVTWTSDKKISPATFIMPAKNVSFTATYEENKWEHGTGEEATPMKYGIAPTWNSWQ